MDHIKIIKRAFQITLDYRVLWVFGIILALTAGGGGGGSFGGGGNGGQYPSGNGEWPGFIPPNLDPQVINTIIFVAIALCCLLIAVGIVFGIGRYVAEVALIRMVNDHEGTGEKVSVKQGFRLGWNRAALRIFLVDLLIGLALWIAFILMMIVAALPLLVWLTDSVPLQVLGTVTTIGLAMLFITLLILAAIIVSLVLNFVRRACVLENLGVFEAIRRGVAVVRQRVGDVILMALIMFGLNLAWTILMIPVALLLIMVSLLVAALPALLAGMITLLFFAQGVVPWIVAFVVGLPIFVLALSIPTLFVGGLEQTFVSSVWTLTYREAVALEATQAEVLPELPGEDNPPLSQASAKV